MSLVSAKKTRKLRKAKKSKGEDSHPEPSTSRNCFTFVTKDPLNWYKALEAFYFDSNDPDDSNTTVDWKENDSKNSAGCPWDTSVKYTEKLTGFTIMNKLFARTHNVIVQGSKSNLQRWLERHYPEANHNPPVIRET